MWRIGCFLILATVSWGLAGCGGGIKEGGPPPGVGYVPPGGEAKNLPEKGAPAR
jgi:hypothetical protein